MAEMDPDPSPAVPVQKHQLQTYRLWGEQDRTSSDKDHFASLAFDVFHRIEMAYYHCVSRLRPPGKMRNVFEVKDTMINVFNSIDGHSKSGANSRIKENLVAFRNMK